MLLDKGTKTIYSAHGKPFSADIIRKALLRENGYAEQIGFVSFQSYSDLRLTHEDESGWPY